VISLLVVLAQDPVTTADAWSWYARFLPFLPFLPVGAVGLAGLTFWLGWRQKERERCFSFYKESVINPCMVNLDGFFAEYREKLTVQAKKPKTSEARKTSPRDLTKFLELFSADLYALQDTIVRRLEVFDTKAVCKVEEAIGQFDTETTMWLCSPGEKDIEILTASLVETKRVLLKSVYKGSFKILL
jgi:hypothetical protein